MLRIILEVLGSLQGLLLCVVIAVGFIATRIVTAFGGDIATSEVTLINAQARLTDPTNNFFDNMEKKLMEAAAKAKAEAEKKEETK
jgi:hypothetical protein